MPTTAITSLDELYQRAGAATAEGSKSFYFATRFFPPQLASAAHAVYWFCRYTDDLVDECATLEQGRRDLDAWETALLTGIQNGSTDSSHPVLRVFLDTAQRYQIPHEYAFELIRGMRMDLEQTRYQTFDELRVFCYRVASVVGLMMCWVIGFRDPADRELALPRAIDLGIAMQLTNILRDIDEDLKRGRIYIPLDEMQRFGYSVEDLQANVRNEAFQNLMRFQAERAQSFYDRGNSGIAMLHPSGRFAVEIASNIYHEILNLLRASSFNVFGNRTVVPTSRKYWITAKSMAVPFLKNLVKRPEPVARTIQISSAAGLLGLLVHYLAFYLIQTPLLTDQISEWMMARTPSRYAIAILAALGPWAKPCAATGALATLGFCLFLSRYLGVWVSSRVRAPMFAVTGIFIACFLCYSIGYSSIPGALAFWIPAIAIITLISPEKTPKAIPQRRQFLSALMAGGVVAVAAESFLRESILEKQAAQPVDLFPFQPALEGRSFGAGLVRHEITSVAEFYGMSKNTVDPSIDLKTWRLKITLNGKLLRSLRFGELLSLSREYRYVTLRCISNTLQSDLMGTAQWGGVQLSQLIDRRSLPANIVEAAFIGVEGHDDSLKLDYAFGPDSLLALGMNGKTLSRTHGFPVRLLAPSYYGCRNVKWLGEIRFVSAPYYGTWQRLGYTREPIIHICSHIDHMRRDGSLLQLGGVSFAGTRGIQSVRVRANQGSWQPARLEPAISPYTWTRWITQFPAPPGARIEANAQDKNGAWQELYPANPFPNGPAGPTIVVARA